MRSNTLIFIGVFIVLMLLFVVNLLCGSVNIPMSDVVDTVFGNAEIGGVNDVIIMSSRLPQATTALLSGAALAVSGLMLQTLFTNPLADPSILGVSSGASLGVAAVMLISGGSIYALGLFGYMAVVLAALVGAMAVLAIIILFSTKIKSNVMLLVVGIMVGYIAGSMVTLLNFNARAEGVVSYLIWGMGDFSGVSQERLPMYALFIVVGLLISFLLIKPMNALLLGERYSMNLGVNIRRTRIFLLLATGILTAIVTAFCGPISFIGLAVPHIARLIFNTSNHKILIPSTILLGAAVALLCNLLTNVISAGEVIPLNVVTPIIGAPVIIYVIVNKKKIAYFS
ncbi:MAG: iron ABC transporter permease [Rikenellaceae bacterium]